MAAARPPFSISMPFSEPVSLLVNTNWRVVREKLTFTPASLLELMSFMMSESLASSLYRPMSSPLIRNS